MNYPLDDTEYKAKVVFGIIATETTGDAAASTLQSTIQKNNTAIKSYQKELDNLIAEVKSKREKDKNFNTAQYKEKGNNLTKQINELKAANQKWQGQLNQTQSEPTIEVTGDTVGLYLPSGLAFRDNVTYENFDLGAKGAAMEAGLGFAESMVKGVGSFVSSITGSNGADLAKLAGIQLAGSVGTLGDEARAVGKLSGGVTLNPNTRVLFKQPNIREFAFTFKFIAKSEEEAEMVDRIIKFFRTELYPDTIDATVGGKPIKLGYRFPNKFSIDFEYDGEDIPGLAKVKPCYLRDVSTTYNASQMAMHSDGRFMEVDMTLAFQETRALTRKDIEGGF